MTALEFAAACASIASFLKQFRSERGSQTTQTIQEYLEWLRRQNHAELADLICKNADLSKSISVMLQDQHQEVMGRLDEVVAELKATFKASRQSSTANEPELSEQAKSILRQLVESGASKARRDFNMHEGVHYTLLGGRSSGGKWETLQLDDEQFVDDDFETLCSLDLLRRD
jgi:hypothetical protein